MIFRPRNASPRSFCVASNNNRSSFSEYARSIPVDPSSNPACRSNHREAPLSASTKGYDNGKTTTLGGQPKGGWQRLLDRQPFWSLFSAVMWRNVSALKPMAKEMECCQTGDWTPSEMSNGASNGVNSVSPIQPSQGSPSLYQVAQRLKKRPAGAKSDPQSLPAVVLPDERHQLRVAYFDQRELGGDKKTI